MKTKLLILLCLITAVSAYAGSATWNLNPASSDWNDPLNWMPNTVPNNPSDVATFATSSQTDVDLSTDVEVSAIAFWPGASQFRITVPAEVPLTISGAGITNESGVVQNFITTEGDGSGDNGSITFSNSATAGISTVITNDAHVFVPQSGGRTTFRDHSTAGSATIVNNGPVVTAGFPGGTIFRNDATAATATIVNNGGANSGIFPGFTSFYETTTAGNASITNNGALPGQVAGGTTAFFGSANAGNASFILTGAGESGQIGGSTNFYQSSSAANATFMIHGGATNFSTIEQAYIVFQDDATAGNGVFVQEGGLGSGAYGGSINFSDNSRSENASFTLNGGQTSGALGSYIIWSQDASADNGTFVLNGSEVAGGPNLWFYDAANGGTARIVFFGNGTLDLRYSNRRELTIGSLEGDGLVLLGSKLLQIGGDNLDTGFAGTIDGQGGVTKAGTGSLMLSNANTYTGGTTVASGILLVSNASGSGTGTGAVTVNGGTLGGSGIIAGAVTVGTNTNTASFLAPSKGSKRPATLAIQGALTLNDDSTYLYKLDTKHRVSDQVLAQGVTIDNGAKFSLRASGTTLTLGQVFTVISNTAATPIAGTFHNLPEGKILTVNGSSLQASYSGGDGNDLTLTVVP